MAFFRSLLDASVHCILFPFDGANFAVDQFWETRFNIVTQPANDETGHILIWIRRRLVRD